ncbi:MAG TPA: transketolase C-terminal domain-containing protein, partial [Thermoleophilia bacterium]|nr:transketolase C-terminal domain-containing protein [Thermoleophilia bacterium]
MAPSSQLELQRMLATALTLDGPAALRYPRGMAVPFAAPEVLEPVEVGRGKVLAEGADVALIGIGTGVGIAAGAAALLHERGLTPTVVDARFVKPLDCELLGRLAATHRLLVTIEENVLAGGFGSAVLEEVAPSRVEVLRFGLPDAFVPHGDRARLLRDAGLTAEAVAAAVAEAVAIDAAVSAAPASAAPAAADAVVPVAPDAAASAALAGAAPPAALEPAEPGNGGRASGGGHGHRRTVDGSRKAAAKPAGPGTQAVAADGQSAAASDASATDPAKLARPH